MIVNRSGPDRCPGALSLHQAADGLLARVRVPGGFATAQVLAGLADAAERYGDGRTEITSRGNIQLRGIYPGDQHLLADELAALGLLPSPTHERVRNIVASPLASDLRALVNELDRGICARPRLAELSGRFLFAFDDGSGDMAQLQPDITARALEGSWQVSPGTLVPTTDVVDAVLAAAEAFLDVRTEQGSRAWRMAELAGGAPGVAQRLGGTAALPEQTPTPHPYGVVGSAMVITVPLGRPTSVQLRVLAECLGEGTARITPWRSIVVPNRPGLIEAVESVGLVVGDSLWNELSACSGAPGCAKAFADVQQGAHDAVAAGKRTPTEAATGRAVHWSGCERRCGHPQGSYVDVLATESGYRIT